MKAKTKLEKEIAYLSERCILPISDNNRAYATEKCFDKEAKATAKGDMTCLECGYHWTDKSKPNIVACPHCQVKLNVIYTRKRKWEYGNYFGIMDRIGNYEVLRSFYAYKRVQVGEKPYYFINEVVRRFIINENKHIVVARLRSSYCLSVGWLHSSNLEIRRETSSYYNSDKYYTALECLCPGYEHNIDERIIRNGFNGDCYQIEPLRLFKSLLYSPKAETLLKTGQIALLRRHINRNDISQYWKSICICNRNGYTIKDAQMWIDYMQMLKSDGKDLLNAKYVCPDNLEAWHNKMVIKRQRAAEIRLRNEKKAWEERDKLKAIETEQAFRELKAKFFGIVFTDSTIKVRVLESVTEFLEEGKEMHHCVFASRYYLRPDSLIFSATIDDKRIETVELSLETLEVVQSRGVCNTKTEYHDRIVKLVNENKSLISRRMSV